MTLRACDRHVVLRVFTDSDEIECRFEKTSDSLWICCTQRFKDDEVEIAMGGSRVGRLQDSLNLSGVPGRELGSVRVEVKEKVENIKAGGSRL